MDGGLAVSWSGFISDLLVYFSWFIVLLFGSGLVVLCRSCRCNPLGREMAKQRRELYFPGVYNDPPRLLLPRYTHPDAFYPRRHQASSR
jgi:hypothetical protein